MNKQYCSPDSETRKCDCNYKKGICHCSDSDCDWEPDPIFCNCDEVKEKKK